MTEINLENPSGFPYSTSWKSFAAEDQAVISALYAEAGAFVRNSEHIAETIVEIGCGPITKGAQVFRADCLQRFENYVGVDINSEFTDEWRAEIQVDPQRTRYVCADLQELGMLDAEFSSTPIDLLVGNRVLNYLPDRAVREIADSERVHGFFFTVPLPRDQKMGQRVLTFNGISIMQYMRDLDMYRRIFTDSDLEHSLLDLRNTGVPSHLAFWKRRQNNGGL